MSSKLKRVSAFAALVSSVLMITGAAADESQGDAKPAVKSCIQTLFRIQPVYKGGGISGIRLYPGTDRNNFVALGFNAGDMFVGSTDGKTLESLMQEFEALLLRQAGDYRTIPLVRMENKYELPVSNSVANRVFADCKT